MLFDKLFDFAGTVEELHPDDPLRKIGEDIGPMFTHLVDVLREPNSFGGFTPFGMQSCAHALGTGLHPQPGPQHGRAGLGLQHGP